MKLRLLKNTEPVKYWQYGATGVLAYYFSCSLSDFIFRSGQLALEWSHNIQNEHCWCYSPESQGYLKLNCHGTSWLVSLFYFIIGCDSNDHTSALLAVKIATIPQALDTLLAIPSLARHSKDAGFNFHRGQQVNLIFYDLLM